MSFVPRWRWELTPREPLQQPGALLDCGACDELPAVTDAIRHFFYLSLILIAFCCKTRYEARPNARPPVQTLGRANAANRFPVRKSANPA
jgi:hypothetical protein